MYRHVVKRLIDILVSGVAILVLSPVFIVLTVLGAALMKGNPFFTQRRPGKNERIFKMLKFRTMTCEKDENGVLLPDEKRLTSYGKWLRSTSLDEIPELVNIFIGNMSLVGPRPLLPEYLPLYNSHQKRRHELRPGLTGLAQINGRNAISWEDKFRLDVEYVDSVSFVVDLKIFVGTFTAVLKRDGISAENSATAEPFRGTPENDETEKLEVL